MIIKKEAWGYGLELTGFILVLAGFLAHSTLNAWDKESLERRYVIQEEVNLAILSSLNDIASMQSTDDKEFNNTLLKNVEDTTNDAYSSVMTEKERRSVTNLESQKTRFWTIEILLLLAGMLFILRGRWISHQAIKEQAGN